VKNLVVLLILILLCSCGVLKTNKYLMHYTVVNDVATIGNNIDRGDKHYPIVREMVNSNACIEEYQRIKPEGYVLLGYSLFDNDEKMSQGLVIQAGMKLGAHLIILSRENGASGVLNHQPLLPDEKIKRGTIVEALVSKPSDELGNTNNHVHMALFLTQCYLDK
jgi:hypothetical protein